MDFRDRDQVAARFFGVVSRNYTNEQYSELVASAQETWANEIHEADGDGDFLALWRENFDPKEEVVLDGLATSVESERLDR